MDFVDQDELEKGIVTLRGELKCLEGSSNDWETGLIQSWTKLTSGQSAHNACYCILIYLAKFLFFSTISSNVIDPHFTHHHTNVTTTDCLWRCSFLFSFALKGKYIVSHIIGCLHLLVSVIKVPGRRWHQKFFLHSILGLWGCGLLWCRCGDLIVQSNNAFSIWPFCYMHNTVSSRNKPDEGICCVDPIVCQLHICYTWLWESC